MKKYIYGVLFSLLSLSTVWAGIKKATIINNSNDVIIYDCRQLTPIHGEWITTLDSAVIYHNGMQIYVEIKSIGHGVQATLYCKFQQAPGAQEVFGYLYVDVNNAGSYLDWFPVRGNLRTSALLSASSGVDTEDMFYIITE